VEEKKSGGGGAEGRGALEKSKDYKKKVLIIKRISGKHPGGTSRPP